MARGDDLLVIVQPVDVEMVVSVDYSGMDLLIDDVVTLTDQLIIGIDYNLVIDDAVVLTDTFATDTVLGLTIDDMVVLTDDLQLGAEFSITIDDGLFVTDSPSLDPGGAINTSDTLTVTDGPVTFIVSKPFADSVTLTDDVVFGKVSNVVFSDSVTVTDAFVKAVDLTFNDAVVMTDQLQSGDPLWNNVVMLMHGDGPNNGQNLQFRDASANNYVLSKTGSPLQGSFSPYSAGGASGYFDGASYFLVGSNANLALGTGNFTIEFWLYPVGAAAVNIFDFRPDGGGIPFPFMYLQSGLLNYYLNGVQIQAAIASGVWSHVALVRSAGSTRLYVNGAQSGATFVDGTDYQQVANRPSIGAGGGSTGASPYVGYMSDFRVDKGLARYTSNFTPPTVPFTPGANTQLLMKFANAAIFDEARKVLLNTVGDAKTSTAQSKFGGASILFDGAGDYLLTQGHGPIGTVDFTIEAWVYPTITPNCALIDYRPASTNGPQPVISIVAAGLIYTVSGVDRITGANPLTVNAWNHVAVSRVSGQTRMFLNGAQTGGTYADATNYTVAASRPVIGASGFGLGTSPYTGYLDDIRVTVGQGRYATNFTPPTKALPDGPAGPVTVTQDMFLADTTTVTDSGIVVSKLHTLTVNDTITMSEVLDGFTTYLTGNSAPSGYAATASSSFDSNYQPFKAFNGVGAAGGDTNRWASGDSAPYPHTLQLQLPAAMLFNGYVTQDTTSSATVAGAQQPKSWVCEGSNDGSTWTLLDTRTNVAQAAQAEKRRYAWNGPGAGTAFRYYRWVISASQGADRNIASWYMCLLKLI